MPICLGGQTFALYFQSKHPTPALPLYAQFKYLDAHQQVKTISTAADTSKTVQITEPNYFYQASNFKVADCDYADRDKAGMLHAKFTCRADITATNLPSIRSVTYNKLYQLDSQNNGVVRLLEPNVSTQNHVLTTEFYKPYYPLDHTSQQIYQDFQIVDEYGNAFDLTLKPNLAQQKAAPTEYGKIEVAFPSQTVLGSSDYGNVKTYPDNYIVLDHTNYLQDYSASHGVMIISGV